MERPQNASRSEASGAQARFEHAKALRELGQLQEAENIYTSLIVEDPDNLQLRTALMWCIFQRSRSDGTWPSRRPEIVNHLRHASFDRPGEVGPIARIDMLVALGEISLARRILTQLILNLETSHGCDRCLSMIPLLTEFGTQGTLFERLLLVSRKIAAKQPSDKNTAAVVELGVLLALGRFVEFMTRYDEMQSSITKERDKFLFAAVRRRLGLPRMQVFNEQKVFGIGLSKTGTTSLAYALELLEIDNGHYTNPITRQLLSDVDFFMLGGATDTPVANCFEKLCFLYPNAKFVLTTRPIQDWISSMHAHYGSPAATRSRIGIPYGFQYGLLGEEVQIGLYTHHQQYETAAKDHEQRVRHFFADKPGRLLIFNVFEGHGWLELCEFLGKTQPQIQFPWSNRRAGE